MPTYLDQQHGVSLSEAYAEAAACAPAGRAMLACYALNHPSFDAPVYIVSDHQNFTATLETSEEVEFVACPVDVVPPEESDDGRSPTIAVRIDGVSRILADQLDLASGSLDLITITERIYASDDPSAPAVMPPLEMTLRDVTVSETTVTAQAGFSDPVNTGFPAKDYLAREYPGLAAR
jgi:hypothetical protein